MQYTGKYSSHAQEVERLIRNATPYGVEEYSGRGMNGAYCMSVIVNKHEVETFFFELGRYLGSAGADTPSQLFQYRTDSMGYDDVVIYWRCYEVHAGEFESETDEA